MDVTCYVGQRQWTWNAPFGEMNQPASKDKAAPAGSAPMKEWIAGAIKSLRLRSKSNTSNQDVDEIVCSREYLSCALKIAHSLANQLSAVEEERYREKISSQQKSDANDVNISHIQDTIDEPWSEYISVYCMTNEVDGKKDETSVNIIEEGAEMHNVEPIPVNTTGGSNSSEQPADLQNLSQQLSTLFDKDNYQSINYMEVEGAKLNEGGERAFSTNGRLGIRSLGTAFYELFSGGQVTAKEGMSNQLSEPLPSSSPTFLEHFSEQVCVSTGASGSIDITGGPLKKRRSTSSTMVRSPSSLISVDPLKSMGLPINLCDLISYMLEGRSGAGHDVNEESYQFISEIRDDLKLMIDSPDAYLRGIDLTEAVNVGLQFGDSLYGRRAEMQALQESFQRSISSECEVAMIRGTSGIGKSKLSEEFIRYATESGSTVLSGRCDKLQSQPLHAISSVFDKHCAWLSVKDRSTAEKVATALKEHLGDDIAHLVNAIPNLANLFGDDLKPKENENDTAMDAQKRLQYLFYEFVAVVSSCHQEPLILFLDDCQWIDNASVALLNQILMMTENNVEGRGFFFGSYRDDEMNDMHPLNLMLSSVKTLYGLETTNINLAPMSRDALNEMLSSTLSLLPRITRPLANILHHKTKGSPLFVKQVMMELCSQRLFYPSLSHRRWVWDADKIIDMKIPDNVATFITKSFDRLPSDVISALVVLSCFGASANISMIEVLEREIEEPLINPLNDAVGHSVLGKRSGEFYFMHDKLQEAAYSMMQPEERCLHHNRYGLALGFVAEREKDDRMLLSAVGQINHGGLQAVIDSEQAVVVAKLNLDAGKIAMDMSDFFVAYSFFDHGISFLRKGHWNDHFNLSLELLNLAAKCAMMNGDHEHLKVHIDQVMHSAKCLEDKCQAISNTVTLLIWSGDVAKAIELISSTLTSLGESIPTIMSSTGINLTLNKTKSLLARLSDDALLSYPLMENPSKILALDLLSKYFQILPFLGERTALMPIIPFKVIQISLTYGMSPLSPVGFAQYGNFLALVRGEFVEGCRYVKLALSLMKKLPTRAQNGSIMFHSNYTKLHVEPMQSAIEFYRDAYIASMKSGNPYAIGCSYVYNTFCFWSGKELRAVVSLMKETIAEAKYQKNLILLTLILPTLRMALMLMGQSSVPYQNDMVNAFGKSSNFDDIVGKHVLSVRQVYFVRLTEALIFRELDQARDIIDTYELVDESASCHFSVTTTPRFYMRFYSGLVLFWLSREMGDKKKSSRSKWLASGVECKMEIEKLAGLASTWNFENKAYLLQAEEQFCRLNFEGAEKLYDAAILSSKVHKFVNEEALANELAGHFYLETGRKNRSVHYFSQAFEKYSEWGAVAKANTLTNYLDGS